MASTAVISPARQRVTTRSKLSGKGCGLRPVYLPRSLAIAIPSRWRCKMYSRSSSATATNTVSINLPVGVVVSIASLRLTNSTCFSVSRSTRSSRSRAFLANRLIDSTITVSPQQRAQFSDAVENDLDSLYSVDLVFVSEHTDAALLQNIEKDGICLLDRYNTKFENLTNAVERLREGVQAYQENPAKIIRDGVIQRFEFTCELAWKTTREFLLDQGFTELNSPKATMRKAFSYGLIDDEQAWIALLNARNQTSHLYDDATAQEIYSQIESEFVSLFDKLIEQLKCG